MSKIDLRKELAWLYKPSAKTISLVDVPAMNFIMIDGKGSPESEQYRQSIEALYPVAYTLKFAMKFAGQDFTVMALEGLWWADDMSAFDPETGNRNAWQWTMMMMQPDFITSTDFEAAVKAARQKKDLPGLSKIRFERFKEGRAAQLMHIGPYSAEGPNILKLHEKIKEIGGELTGKHHEIYLSDPRRTDPSKWKTVIRQPYRI